MFRKRGGEEGRKVSSFQLRYLSTNLSFYANSFRKYTHDCIDFHECPPFLLNENDNRRSSSTLIKKKRKKKNEITFYYWNKQRAQFLRQLSLHTGCVTLWLLRRMLVPRDGNGARSRPLNNGQFYHWQWIMTPLSLSYAKIRLLVGGQNIVCGGYLRGGGRARVELSTKVRLRLPPSLPVLPCYLIVLLVRRDAPSWSRFSPPLPLRPSPVRDGPRSLLALSSPRRFFSLPLSPPPPFLATRPFLPLAQRSPNCVSFEL